MKRGNVDFTFLHRVEEIELNIRDERWQSALALALTIPDICGGIAFPDLVKRYRDGRVMYDRQKNPTRDVGSQYIRWFDEFASEHFKISPEDSGPYICGERCWQLRCEYLHQNKGFLNDDSEDNVRFHLGINCGTSVCQMEVDQIPSDNENIRIDIEQFCLRMCKAARSYYYAVYREKDFSIYNTPVLDFVQAQQGTRTNPLIAILCDNQPYGLGLSLALRQLTEQAMTFTSVEDAKKALGKRKPVMWIVTEKMLRQAEQPWKAGGNRPVILLAEGSKEALQKTIENMYGTDKKAEKFTILSMPVHLEELRESVQKGLQ